QKSARLPPGSSETLGSRHADNDNRSGGNHGPSDGLSKENRCQEKAKEWLQQLQLPDACDAAERQPAIPKDESNQHTENGNISETEPSRRTDVIPYSGQCQ